MRINLMTIYAIKTVKNIAEDDNEIVTSKTIAEEENIPHGVLMKVLRKLRLNNIVQSHQGRGQLAGGYSLGTPISEITLLKIVEIMEGPFKLSLIRGENQNVQEQTAISESINMDRNSCLNRIELEYERITEVIRQEMSRYTLEELFKDKRLL